MSALARMVMQKFFPKIEHLFAPELDLRETDVTDFEAPRPFGPVVRGVNYWFRRR